MPLTNDEEAFANPQPPANYKHAQVREDTHPLSNADFRKLLMTPSASSHRSEAPQSVRGDSSAASKFKKGGKSEESEKRKEKKLFYASLVKEAKEREVELAKKYRDRAKERREVKDGETPTINTTGNFKAVAPDIGFGDNADRRKQIIEESKYLGGDLEHTHLVKGLDYALLQKVKNELDNQTDEIEERLEQQVEQDDEDDDDVVSGALTKKPVGGKPKLLPKPFKDAKEAVVQQPTQSPDDYDENKVVFKSKLSRGIYRAAFRPEPPKINELFLPRRMAYVIDLDDEETDIPITLIRSKADCPNQDQNTTLTTNDIVINKLTQILSYLRQGGKKDLKKLKKVQMKLEENVGDGVRKDTTQKNLSIYDDIDDYVPDLQKRSDNDKKNEEVYGDKSVVKKPQTYFSNKDEPERDRFRDTGKEQGPSKEAAHAFIKNINEKYATSAKAEPKQKETDKKMSVKFEPDSYAECYPGTIAEEDVNVDSDEEPDFDKMDLGNKKGPVKRWDFDTPEEYSDYMSNREALPKAAFQYGVKMNDGRKTRTAFDPKTQKAKIDKEWNEISKLIDKRKSGEGGGSDYKKPKY